MGFKPFKCYVGTFRHRQQAFWVLVTLLPNRYLPNKRFFFKKWANPGLFLFIFVLFSSQFKCKLKKHRCCAWGSNPGLENIIHRQIHWANGGSNQTKKLPVLLEYILDQAWQGQFDIRHDQVWGLSVGPLIEFSDRGLGLELLVLVDGDREGEQHQHEVDDKQESTDSRRLTFCYLKTFWCCSCSCCGLSAFCQERDRSWYMHYYIKSNWFYLVNVQHQLTKVGCFVNKTILYYCN